MPIRVQRKRAKGWKMPPDTVYVGRGTIWGNPFHRENTGSVHPAVRFACEIAPLLTPEVLRPLRGKNLACWCGPEEDCHADTLLRIANR